MFPALVAISLIYSSEDWHQAVGATQVEDFEELTPEPLPIAGGSILLGKLTVELDPQTSDNAGFPGVWMGPEFDRDIPAEHVLLISSETPGPRTIDAVFDTPVRGYAMNVDWCEHQDIDVCPAFVGVVFDQPQTRGSLWEPAGCEVSWCAFSSVEWAPVPEPGTGALLAAGLALLGRYASRFDGDALARGNGALGNEGRLDVDR